MGRALVGVAGEGRVREGGGRSLISLEVIGQGIKEVRGGSFDGRIEGVDASNLSDDNLAAVELTATFLGRPRGFIGGFAGTGGPSSVPSVMEITLYGRPLRFRGLDDFSRTSSVEPSIGVCAFGGSEFCFSIVLPSQHFSKSPIIVSRLFTGLNPYPLSALESFAVVKLWKSGCFLTTGAGSWASDETLAFLTSESLLRR